MASRRWALALVLAAAAGTASAQHMYRCGSVYQDHPCENQEAQKRFEHGHFEMDRAHPDTDRECTRAVSELIPLWKRLHAGEPLAKLQNQIEARPFDGRNKGDLRSMFVALQESDTTGPQARANLEVQCMAYKRGKTAAKSPAH
ncbi:hypothetical protein ACPWT1_06590 [Ramlibacter sp. MMS24-I3-19]|uniref:hypothetical protein n=1 Tax=Ramlibacter sp. MMS24-I3-19 TaxID=3416606 RepID=UPI003D0253BE